MHMIENRHKCLKKLMNIIELHIHKRICRAACNLQYIRHNVRRLHKDPNKLFSLIFYEWNSKCIPNKYKFILWNRMEVIAHGLNLWISISIGTAEHTKWSKAYLFVFIRIYDIQREVKTYLTNGKIMHLHSYWTKKNSPNQCNHAFIEIFINQIKLPSPYDPCPLRK